MFLLAEDVTASQRTKHADSARLRLVNEFVEAGFVKIIFVHSAENEPGIFAKNLGGELHGKHVREKGLLAWKRMMIMRAINKESRKMYVVCHSWQVGSLRKGAGG
jgi:hypothetical protein